MDGAQRRNGHLAGGIYAETLEGSDSGGTKEDFGDANSVRVPEEYRKEAIVYLPLKYGLVTYKELCDGTLSFKQFCRAKKQAEFMDWVERQTYNKVARKQKDEVEYFD